VLATPQPVLNYIRVFTATVCARLEIKKVILALGVLFCPQWKAGRAYAAKERRRWR
jgi:hypothetical protein